MDSENRSEIHVAVGQRWLPAARRSGARYPDGNAEPKFALMDETDSGLISTRCGSSPRASPPARAEHRHPDDHALSALISCRTAHGVRRRIVKSGDKDLAPELEAKGYDCEEGTVAAVA
jgi:hypothetical protein